FDSSKNRPYTPQQNDVAERKNKVLQDMINAIIIAKKLKVSPFEIWKGRKPNISYFRVWGCFAYYKVPLPNTSRLGTRCLESVFMRYAKDSKSYHCLDLDSNVIVESRDVDFFENKFHHDSTSINEIVTQILQDISGLDLNSNNKRNMAVSSSAPRRSENARKERNLDPGFVDSQAIIFLVEGNNENNVVNKITILLNVENASKTYKKVITSRNSAFWKEAIDDEIDSLVSNNTWELSDLPPVARITSIRVLFALASIYILPIHQMDVKTAFLNGVLEEEVYMKQPEGFVLPGHENKVCKLKKSLYGLKQAPKQWHDKFDKSILSNGFTHNSSDRCIYSKFTEDYGVILCLYVDDILIVGTNMKGIKETKKFLSSCFQMKDMNEVDTIFGIKVKRHSRGYGLNQYHYIDKIIDKFRHLYIEEANTSYESSYKLVENDGRAIDQIEYASAIGLIHQRTAPYTPQQNDVAERKNRVLKDMINAMLVSANLPKNLVDVTPPDGAWTEHVSGGVTLLSISSTKHKERPLRVETSPRDSNVIVESRDVDLFENKFRHDSTSTNEIVTQIPQDISSPYLNYFNKRNMAQSFSAPRRSERARKERNLDPDFIDSQAIIFLVEEAIDDEMDSLVSNNTWKLSDLSPGFSQRQGVDYFDTYAPVARITSIRVLFALASIYNLSIHQMDVKTAFLNGDLDKEVYMKQPEGFVLPGHENKFTEDYSVILCLYVDDILIVGTNMEGINETKKSLSLCFQMKDMNEVDTILGIKVKRHKEANTPYESSCKLVENDGRAVAQIEYASAIGFFNDHWKAIGRVFGYLKRTRQLALYYDRFDAVLEGYLDASWITGSSDSKSITGWIFTLGGGAVCWGSKKQTCIIHSTMEAEFLALVAVGKEAEWLRNMLLDIELWPQPMLDIFLHCDSQSMLSRAYNKVYNGKSRHISLRHAYIKELISIGIITIEYIRSCKNLADPFTKGLPKYIVFGTTREMGLKPIK
ncbi:zinc finger, CCHC-type containing protein, partial [Tanacetum coccineum]